MHGYPEPYRTFFAQPLCLRIPLDLDCGMDNALPGLHCLGNAYRLALNALTLPLWRCIGRRARAV